MAEAGWLALVATPHPGAAPVVEAGSGAPAGFLLLRRGGTTPHRDAVRIEPALIGDGPPLAVSLVLPTPATRPLFDDPAVVQAMRAVLRDPGRAPLLCTLVEGSTRWAGAISGVSPEVARARPGWWDEDPFARLGRRLRLVVPAGLLVPVPPPVGPGHQRHSGAPWPWGRFVGRVPDSGDMSTDDALCPAEET